MNCRLITLLLVLLAICAIVDFNEVSASSSSDEKLLSEARKLRETIKRRFEAANEAQAQMMEAEVSVDVDTYEKALEIMREEDQKMLEGQSQYEELRGRILASDIDVDLDNY